VIDFSKLSRNVEHAVGSPTAFILASVSIIVWCVTGPFFGFSDTWQLIINTATTICTFLMVFLIQGTQTRDTQALHIKLDELIRVTAEARNEMINVEQLDQQTLDQVRDNLSRESSQSDV
jgi:low affinity Fe/Cu permease